MEVQSILALALGVFCRVYGLCMHVNIAVGFRRMLRGLLWRDVVRSSSLLLHVYSLPRDVYDVQIPENHTLANMMYAISRSGALGCEVHTEWDAVKRSCTALCTLAYIAGGTPAARMSKRSCSHPLQSAVQRRPAYYTLSWRLWRFSLQIHGCSRMLFCITVAPDRPSVIITEVGFTNWTT